MFGKKNHHTVKHRAEDPPLVGFGTGWYFPESLEAVPSLELGAAGDIKLPPMGEYLASLRQGLARTALEEECIRNDPAKRAEFEAAMANRLPINLRPLPARVSTHGTTAAHRLK